MTCDKGLIQETLLKPPSSWGRSGCLRWRLGPLGGGWRGRSGPTSSAPASGLRHPVEAYLHQDRPSNTSLGRAVWRLVNINKTVWHLEHLPQFSTISALFFLLSNSGLQPGRHVKLARGHPAMPCNWSHRRCFLLLHAISYNACYQTVTAGVWLQPWKTRGALLYLSPLLPPALRWASMLAHSLCWAIKDEHMRSLK